MKRLEPTHNCPLGRKTNSEICKPTPHPFFFWRKILSQKRPTRAHRDTNTNTLADTCNTHARTHVHTKPAPTHNTNNTHTHAHTRTHAYAHTQTHTHKHTHTHTHTHTASPAFGGVANRTTVNNATAIVSHCLSMATTLLKTVPNCTKIYPPPQIILLVILTNIECIRTHTHAHPRTHAHTQTHTHTHTHHITCVGRYRKSHDREQCHSYNPDYPFPCLHGNKCSP